MGPTCIIIATQPFFVFKVYLAISGSSRSLLHMIRTACPMSLLFDSSLPLHNQGGPLTMPMQPASSGRRLPRCLGAASEPAKCSRCQTLLPSLWFPLHFGIHSGARADGKTALLPSHLRVNLGPKATALRLWMWQSEKIVSCHSVWGLFNRSHIYSLGLN